LRLYASPGRAVIVSNCVSNWPKNWAKGLPPPPMYLSVLILMMHQLCRVQLHHQLLCRQTQPLPIKASLQQKKIDLRLIIEAMQVHRSDDMCPSICLEWIKSDELASLVHYRCVTSMMARHRCCWWWW
jgi:hypothetical protein